MKRVAPAVSIISSILLSACVPAIGGGSRRDQDPEDIEIPEIEPISELDFEGTYTVTYHWDLSAPVIEDEGIGAVVADLLFDIVIEQAGLPSFLEGEARSLLEAFLEDVITDFVNDLIPDELLPNGEFMNDIADALQNVEVDTVLTLRADDTDPNLVIGSEQVVAVRVIYGDREISYTPEQLSPLAGNAITSTISGRVISKTRIRFDTHRNRLHYGSLLSLVAADLLDVPDIAELSRQAGEQLNCAALADDLTSGISCLLTSTARSRLPSAEPSPCSTSTQTGPWISSSLTLATPPT